MILVAGGTGRLGTLVVERLIAAGHPVRVLTRDSRRAAHLAGAELVVGDVRDPESLPAAVAGTDCVISAVHGFAGTGGVTPASVDRDGNANLVGAAVAAGAAMVLVSAAGARADHPLELFRMKHAAEQHLRASGAAWTIVRPAAFLELWLEILTQTAGRSGRPLVFGRGANPINFVPVADVAASVAGAATDAGTRGRSIDVLGEDQTFNALAASVGSPRHVPRPLLRALAPAVARARAALVMDTADFSGASAAAG